VQDIADALDADEEMDAIFLDMKKAFDKVDHKILIQKLAGVIDDEAVVKTVQDFLSGRTQKVLSGNAISAEISVTSGVPQGSVIGPLLFIIYINDLAKDMQSKVRLFADDCVIYSKIKGDRDVILLQKDLDAGQRWMTNNKMSLNLDKCEVVTFTTKSKQRDTIYEIADQRLPLKAGYKYLGVWLDKKLDWSKHVDQIISKCIKNINFVFRNLSGTCTRTKAKAYKTLLRPLLEYGSAVWDPYKDTNKKALEKVQSIAVRRVTGRMKRWKIERNKKNVMCKLWESPTEMKKELGWESLESRRKVARLCNLYKIREGARGWNELSSIIKERSYKGRTGQGGLLQEPNAKKNCGKFSFVARTTRDWNQLDCGSFPHEMAITQFRHKVLENMNCSI
jgi:hypothetical protein